MSISKKEIICILLVMAVSVLIVIWIYPKFSFIGTDGAIYAWLGENIAQGKGFSLGGQPHLVFPPLFSFSIAFFFLIIKNLELAAHIATIFFGLISLPLFYLLLRKMSSRKIALVGTCLFAFSGYMIWNYTVVPTPQILASFLAIFTFLLLFKISFLKVCANKHLIWFFLAGLVIGLSYLCRTEYFFLIFPVLIYVCFIYKKIFSFKKILAMILTIILGFIIISTPYLLFLHNNLGYWTISGKTYLLLPEIIGQDYESIDNPVDENFNTPAINSSKIESGALAVFLENPGPILKKFFKGLRNIERSFVKIFGIIGMIFFAFGLRDFILKKHFKELFIILISFIPIFFIALVIEGGKTNYLIQFFYLFFILIAFGFWTILDDISLRFKFTYKKARIFAIILLLVSSFYLFFPLLQQYYFLPDSYKADRFKSMGTWMRENILNLENETVLARKPDVSFYAGARWQILPNVGDFEELFRLMKINNVKYIVADDYYFKQTRPQFIDLLTPEKAPDDLRLMKVISSKGGQVFLYSLY